MLLPSFGAKNVFSREGSGAVLSKNAFSFAIGINPSFLISSAMLFAKTASLTQVLHSFAKFVLLLYNNLPASSFKSTTIAFLPFRLAIFINSLKALLLKIYFFGSSIAEIVNISSSAGLSLTGGFSTASGGCEEGGAIFLLSGLIS